jgi:ribonuclease HI
MICLRNDCQSQVNGFQAAKFKKFSTHAEAWEFAYPGRPINAGTSTSGATSTSAVVDPPTASTSAVASRHRKKKPYTNTKTVKAPLSHNAFAAEPDEADFDVVVYTDGACKNNQGGAAAKRAGLGVFFGVSDPRNIAERVPGEQTNNRAELLALVRALEVIPHKQQKVMMKTDSKYSIQCKCMQKTFEYVFLTHCRYGSVDTWVDEEWMEDIQSTACRKWGHHSILACPP